MDVDDIMSKQGDAAKLNEIVAQFELGATVELAKFSSHDLCATLKLYFCSLPETILTDQLYRGFLEAGQNGASNVMLIMRNLPEANKNALHKFILLLEGISAYSTINCMTSSRLATAVAPTFLQRQSGQPVHSANDKLLLLTFVQILIEKEKEIF